MTMQSKIFYFSGTGNSLAAARRIAHAIGPCQLLPMTAAEKNGGGFDVDAQRVGLVFPLYFGGLPNVVAEFISRASFVRAEYLFIVVTAGHNLGTAVSEAEAILQRKGTNLSYARYLVMPDNYIPIFALAEKNVRATLAAAEPALNRIINDISVGRHGNAERNLHMGAMVKLWHRLWKRSAHRKDANFTVDETCPACGLCADVCPAENIRLEDKRPRWQHHCEQCFACLQFCPQQAIQYGKSTRNRLRYRHPDIKAADIALQHKPDINK